MKFKGLTLGLFALGCVFPLPAVAANAWAVATSAHIWPYVNAHKPRLLPSGRHTALINLKVDGGGNVVAAMLLKSAGRPDLDAAALAAVRDASPVPRPPGVGYGETVDATLPVSFYKTRAQARRLTDEGAICPMC